MPLPDTRLRSAHDDVRDQASIRGLDQHIISQDRSDFGVVQPVVRLVCRPGETADQVKSSGIQP